MPTSDLTAVSLISSYSDKTCFHLTIWVREESLRAQRKLHIKHDPTCCTQNPLDTSPNTTLSALQYSIQVYGSNSLKLNFGNSIETLSVPVIKDRSDRRFSYTSYHPRLFPNAFLTGQSLNIIILFTGIVLGYD